MTSSQLLVESQVTTPGHCWFLHKNEGTNNGRIPQEEIMSKLNEQASNDPSVFGGCPQCHRNDGYHRNVGRTHWYFCTEHKTKWVWGSNLDSSWRTDSEDDWVANQVFLKSFAKVKPVYPPVLPPTGDIIRILAYLHAEQADYHACEPAEQQGHIFVAIQNVQSWVDGQLDAGTNIA